MAIVSGKPYYMVPALYPGRGCTFEVWFNWDYVLLANVAGPATKPNGTPVKLLKQSSGRYKIQMQSTNYGLDYSYFYRDPKWESEYEAWVKLERAENADEFELTPKENGYIIAMHDSWPNGIKFTYYLNCFAEVKSWATLWKSPPGNPLIWTFVPA